MSSGTLRLWLRADAGVVTNGAGIVQQWTDQSGLANNATQSSTSQRPVLVTNIFNGHPAIRFDGIQSGSTGDYLQGSGDVAVANGLTCFTVYSRAGSAQEQALVVVGTPFDFDAVRSCYIRNGDEMASSAWNNDYGSGFHVPANTCRIRTDRVNSTKTQWEFFDWNGDTMFTTNVATSGFLTPSAGYYVGGLGSSIRNFQGDIAEIIYYQGSLNDADRQSVQNYLDAKYAPGAIQIIRDLQSQVIAVGSSATFSLSVSGNQPISYQWFFNDTLISTNASLLITNAQTGAAGNYYAIVSNAYSSATSAVATLSVKIPVSISNQPQDQSAVVGDTAMFTVSATGDLLTYQWRFNGTNIAGATNSTLSLVDVRTTNAGLYAVRITNSVSSVLSSNAVLSVFSPPVITTNLQSRLIAVGATTTFNVAVTGSQPIGYQWFFNDELISTNSSLVLTNAPLSASGSYYVIAANPFGSATSAVATLSVKIPVSISSQPQNQSVIASNTAVFTVSASGDLPNYQWRFNGVNIAGATNSYLSVANATPANAGLYSVLITNSVSSVLSSNASLSIVFQPEITSFPTNYTALAGGNVTMSVDLQPVLPPVNSILRLWLKADQGVVTNANGQVSLWKDQSAFTNNAAQANLNQQPLLVNNVFNSRPALRFDGTQSSSTGDYLHGLGNVGLTNGFTCFIVYSRGGTALEQALSVVGVPLDFNGVRSSYIRNSDEMAASAWNNDYGSGFHVPANTCRIRTDRINNSKTQWEFFDLDITNSFTTSVSISNLLTPGAGYYIGGLSNQTRNFKGDVAEVLYYQDSLTDDDRAKVESYLSAKYFTSHLNGSFSYQWQFNGVDVVGATNATLSLTNVQPANAGFYSVVVSNIAGVAVASNAVLTVNIPPSISTQPQSQSINAGQTASFGVEASGTGPISYHWQKGANNISSATNTSLTLTNLQPADAGSYRVVVSSAYGSVTSTVATLTVNVSTVRAIDANTTSATTINVPIQFTALGNENAVGFSLLFDPNIFTYVGASLGGGFSQATLIANTNQIASGKVGLGMGLSANQTFAAGTQQVIQVSFKVAPVTNAQTSAITFGDTPTIRQISDATAHSLWSAFYGATIAIAAVDFEGDVSTRPTGDRVLSITDWVQVGRFVAGLDTIANGSEFQRADCAPRSSGGNGSLSVTDWVQAGRFATGADPLTPATGPTGGFALAKAKPAPADFDPNRVIQIQSNTLTDKTNVVSVELVAVGNENAIGFSLSYDPTALTFVNAAIGNSASNAFLNLNTNEASVGKLGFAIALSTGATFSPGTQQVVKLTFAAASSTHGTTSLTFTDSPILREVSDSGANSLAASYSDASLTLPGDLLLTITNTVNGVLLAWPASATGFTLESSSSWTNWANVTNSLNTNGGVITTTIPLGEEPQFYRLKK